MNNRELSIILEYIEDLKDCSYGFPRSFSKWQKEYFYQNAYSRWAANEILGLLRRSKAYSSIPVLEEFVRKMDKYACMKSDNSLMFSIAKDTAEDILDRFLAMK